MTSDRFAADLAAVIRSALPEATGLGAPRRLSGGASRESWAFDAMTPAGPVPLILRRAQGAEGPGGGGAEMETSLGPATEAKLQALAFAGGVPVARVRRVLEPADGLGAGYIMDRIAGQTIARRILRDDGLADVRPRLAGQCGAALAAIHALPAGDVADDLKTLSAEQELARYRRVHDGFGEPHPVFEAAFKWIESRLPETPRLTVVHGDFRNGNFVVAPDGLRAVLDWELAHIGDPMSDLGWICVPSWRYGELDRPVGGFGTRDDLFAGYEAAGGGPVDAERVRFWEVFGTLKWGVICQMLCFAHLEGRVRSVERAAIGRRVSETEIDLVTYLSGEGG